MFTDMRDEDKEEGMENWDEDTLRDAVEKKQRKGNATKIICKYFLKAIEDMKYGWFWYVLLGCLLLCGR